MPPASTSQRGAKADLFYGASGTRKTTNIGNAALYHYEKTGKVSRLVSGDGGGWEPIQALVDAGIVIPWAIRLRSKQIEAWDMAAQGYWPQDTANPFSALEPPSIMEYIGYCANCTAKKHGKPATEVPLTDRVIVYPATSKQPIASQIACPACKAQVGTRAIDVQLLQSLKINPANDMSNIALVGYEGLTSCGDTMLEYLMKTKASLSQDPAYTLIDGEHSYSGGNMSYYGFVQSRLYEFVHKSSMMPWVDRVVWTALEAKGEDPTDKSPVYGPAIAGKKATGKAGQWFGNMLHFESVETVTTVDANTQQAKVETKTLMYLRPHADKLSKIPFHAKTRAPFQYASLLPEWMEPDVKMFYQKLDELKAKADADLAKTMKPATAGTGTK